MGESRTVKIALKNGFAPTDACFYTLSTYDQISESDLDPYNRKYMQVYVNSVASLDIYVGNATSEAALVESKPVTASAYNFTYPNTRNFYVVVSPQQGSSTGDHALDLTFRYYEYDPKCHYYQDWNGTDCWNNYTRYCEELTPQWAEELGNPDLRVLYNGSACVIAQTFTETVTNIYENVTTKIRVVPSEEYLARKAKAKAYADALANTPDARADEDLIRYDKGLTLNNDKRKPQNAQTLMASCILLGSFVYSIAEAVAHRRKMKLEEMQLKEMELEMEAEKHAAPENGGNTAFGSLEHGGDERGQEMFNAFKWQQEELSERQIRNVSVNS